MCLLIKGQIPWQDLVTATALVWCTDGWHRYLREMESSIPANLPIKQVITSITLHIVFFPPSFLLNSVNQHCSSTEHHTLSNNGLAVFPDWVKQVSCKMLHRKCHNRKQPVIFQQLESIDNYTDAGHSCTTSNLHIDRLHHALPRKKTAPSHTCTLSLKIEGTQ